MRALIVVVIAGCYNPAGIQPCTVSCLGPDDCSSGLACIDQLCKTQSGSCGGDAMTADVPVDAGVCFGRPEMGGLFSICVPAAPTDSIDLVDPIDTDGSQCLASSAAACVIIADHISINSSITPVGSRPLVLIGASTVTLGASGSIDIASHFGRGAGTGAQTDCSQLISGGSVAGGSPGGAGGSYGGLGGSGGGGGLSGEETPPVAAGMIDAVNGGCPGGRGGTGGSAGMTTQAAGGSGGGAVYMISSMIITLDGEITASGQGGAGGVGLRAGGGGGGSGGLIGFDAPSIRGNPTLVANGGGGGEGGDGTANGNRGGDPTGVGFAPGGGGGSQGGDGGAGSGKASGAVAGETTGAFNVGGGGGGGGAGTILFVDPDQMATCNCSPTPSQTPL